MDVFLAILGAIFIIAGIIGCLLPGLPGPPLSYIGVLLLYFTKFSTLSVQFLIAWAIVVTMVTLLDYYVPIWGTQKFGGGKKGTLGSVIGVFVGIFLFPPYGIIIGPFIGAFIGETIDGKSSTKALRAAFGSFVGFIAGTLLKLIVSGILAFYFFRDIVIAIF